MRRHACRSGIVRVFAMLAIGGMASGCIFQTEPAERDLPDLAGGDADTAVDAGDTGAVDARDGETGPVDAADAGDTSEPTGEACSYDGLDEGVCSEGRTVTAGSDAGERVSGDGGIRCRAPETYRADEAPSQSCDDLEDCPVCDGLDNDCDGVADEGCLCEFNQVSDGVCSNGTVSMNEGRCDPPDNYAIDETSCDGKDNDCDGVGDEGCRCIYPGGEKQVGVCEQGTKSPEDGTCQSPSDFVAEEDGDDCDAKDNDCDGEVDEHEACACEPGETEACYTGPSGTAGTGVCSSGTRECGDDGRWGECTDEQLPASDGEACASDGTADGTDEDCDGVKDEGCQCPYDGNAEGVCGDATIGSKGNCKQPSKYQRDESSCDGLDNDCDGIADEGCPCDYQGNTQGVCSDGTIDEETGNCEAPSDYEDPEQSCDSKDNDCDGDVDDADGDLSCQCDQGETEDCYTGPSGTAGTGICKQGTKTCQADGTWGECGNETTPATSPSNDEDSSNCGDTKDNDCDGTDDDGCPCNYDGQSAGVCTDQTIDTDGDCTEPSAYQDPENTCDDTLDNDCDGDADCADGDCDGEICGEGAGGAVCRDATCTETSCGDGEDNDNDGNTDCADSDCETQQCDGSGSACASGSCTETNCGDGTDNDNDGDGDCQDADCTGVVCDGSGSVCKSGDDICHETACEDGTDNDNDGNTDCRDTADCPGCGTGAMCTQAGECAETECGDSVDNDGDGQTDCEDSDCDNKVCGSAAVGEKCCDPNSSSCSNTISCGG